MPETPTGQTGAGTGREIDMTRPHWGHNYFLNRRNDDGSWRASIISTPIVRDGDVVLISQASGDVGRYRASDVEWLRDPDDMCHCTLTFEEARRG